MRNHWTPTLVALAVGLAFVACKAPAPVGAEAPAPAAQVSAAPAPAPAAQVSAAPAPTAPVATRVAAAAPTAAATSKGRLQAANPLADLGEVAQGEKATHTFILKNVGTEVVHIARAKGS